MFFLNLSALEFFALASALGGFVTALYLLDRSRRKRVVSTLRFWKISGNIEQRRTRRHMQQPWSLLLQLLGLVLLLLAIAQVQLGSRASRRHDRILLVDTSAWSAANLNGSTLLEKERAAAQAYVGALPAQDRVLVVAVDALASPVGFWTSDRKRIRHDLDSLTPGYAALDLDHAFSFASSAAKWDASMGEIVYIGPARAERLPQRGLPNLRAIILPTPRENCGIRAVSVTRSDGGAGAWKAVVTVANDGEQPRRVRLDTNFSGARFSPRQVTIPGGAETQIEVAFTTRTAGSLSADLSLATPNGTDVLASDNHAEVLLPAASAPEVIAYTKRPEAWKPLLEAGRELSVRYLDPSQYRPAGGSGVFLFDQFVPIKVSQPAIYVFPDRSGSPLPVKTVSRDARLANWSVEGLRAVGSDDTGLRERELRFSEARVFATSQNDLTIASVNEGPVIVARHSPNSPRLVAIGFDMLDPRLRADVTTPLLLANLLHWLSPEAFTGVDYTAYPVGTAALPLEPGESANNLQFTGEQGRLVPFTVQKGTVEIFIDRPQTVHLSSGVRERVISFALPSVARSSWHPPASVPSGLPRPTRLQPKAVDLWQWLALAGALALITEWMLFGRSRRFTFRRTTLRPSAGGKTRKARERIPA